MLKIDKRAVSGLNLKDMNAEVFEEYRQRSRIQIHAGPTISRRKLDQNPGFFISPESKPIVPNTMRAIFQPSVINEEAAVI